MKSNFSTATVFQVHRGDNLPHQVCENCLKLVESTFELIARAQSSEKYFFNILKSIESGNFMVIIL